MKKKLQRSSSFSMIYRRMKWTLWNFAWEELIQKKIENVVTIHVSWAYLTKSNKRGKNNLRAWFKESEGSVSKKFWIVGDFAHNKKLKISRVEKVLRSIPYSIRNIFYTQSLKWNINLQCHQPMELGQGKTSNYA